MVLAPKQAPDTETSKNLFHFQGSPQGYLPCVTVALRQLTDESEDEELSALLTRSVINILFGCIKKTSR